MTALAFRGADLRSIWADLLKKFADDPRDAASIMDMSVVVQLLGDQENGLALQSFALNIARLYRSECSVPAPGLRLLVFAAALDIGGNTPIEFLLEGSDIEIYTLYVSPGMPLPHPLPAHDIAFVAVPDSVEACAVLAQVERWISGWPCPVLNHPKKIAHLSRDFLSGLLKSIPGVYIPMTARVSRACLSAIGRKAASLRESLEDGRFPLVVRPIDSHAGRGLAKIDAPSSIEEYLAQRSETEFFISRYVDYCGADGLYRKYRIVVIDGQAYACHMALSDQWKIWYLNADMAMSAMKRAEEECFMATFEDAFGKRYAGALAEIAECIGLDYFAIDCAETRDGRLLVFECHNAMIVHNMDPPAVYPYKPPQMRKIFDAFAGMIHARSEPPNLLATSTAAMEAPSPAGITLDPEDWRDVRAQGHRMLDDMFDFLEHIRSRPTWRPMPEPVRAQFRAKMPRLPQPLNEVYDDFKQHILPYAVGNVHPGFLGWVHGGGTVVGMLAEMLAAGLNANLGGRDHAPIEVERQITGWIAQVIGFPKGASGIFVTGTSVANFVGLLVARTAVLGKCARRSGTGEKGARLRAYTSVAAHSCVAQAMDMAGFGTEALRCVPVDWRHRIDVAALRAAVAADRNNGWKPFLVVGSAGTVDVGAIDDLASLRAVCTDEKMWFHVDGAYGALAALSPELAPRLAGIESADSVAFDFHKWGQVPYDAGFILVREGVLHRETFESSPPYLRRETRGLAAGMDWPCDFGPDISRGFRALKVWFTLKAYGTERIGAVIARSCATARYLEKRILAEPELELLAPVQLNIVCFRYRAADADNVNADIVADIQEMGIAAPSTTVIDGRLAIRAALFNHRTQPRDVDALIKATLRRGRANTQKALAS